MVNDMRTMERKETIDGVEKYRKGNMYKLYLKSKA